MCVYVYVSVRTTTKKQKTNSHEHTRTHTHTHTHARTHTHTQVLSDPTTVSKLYLPATLDQHKHTVVSSAPLKEIIKHLAGAPITVNG